MRGGRILKNLRCVLDGREAFEAERKAFRIRLVARTAWPEDRRSVEALQPFTEHGTIRLLAEATGDMDDALRINSHQVPVVSKVMNRAQREAIHDRGDPSLLIRVIDDMRGLDELRLP